MNGKQSRRFQAHSEKISCLAFSPDGKQILSGSWDHSAMLWDERGNLLRTFTGHDSIVTRVAFSPNGKTVLTASKDNTIRLWENSGITPGELLTKNLIDTLTASQKQVFGIH